MTSEEADARFQSALAPLMEQFVQEKRACGYRYRKAARTLAGFDRLTPTARFPLRHLIMPEVFRLLCGCGFRLGEVLHLQVADVDL
jgi:hypothetical protein